MSLQPTRLQLKEWLKAESLRETIKEIGSTGEIIDSLYSYLTLIYKEEDWDQYKWEEIAEFFQLGIIENLPTVEFPMLNSSGSERDTDELPWEYPERIWYVWANIFASEYGWDLSYIAELDIDDAMGLMQEVVIVKQLDKEWDWNLSELTYSYDQVTKTSKHSEYPRPHWMLPPMEEPKPIKVLKSMLPQGLIIGDSEDVKH